MKKSLISKARKRSSSYANDNNSSASFKMAIRLTNRVLLLAMLFFTIASNGEATQPMFAEPIINLTVPVGRDATFECRVNGLGGYRVGWVKADTKAIQAIHYNVITHNSRVSISHLNHVSWYLHIRRVEEEDGGIYMCQVNTDPMQSQIGILKVVVSPDFIQGETSGDEIVREGTHLFLTCKASGRPAPRVEWRREDGSDIIIRDGSTRIKVPTYVGSTLNMTKILRSEMGFYLCIASNGVPPAVSKRIQVSVTFPPVINVRNQLVGAPLGTSVTLECTVEAYPKPIYYWMVTPGEEYLTSARISYKSKRRTPYGFISTTTTKTPLMRDRMLLSNDRLDIGEQYLSSFETRMYITVKYFKSEDIGSYRCISKNSLGVVESSVRLYEITGSTFVSRFADQDYDNEYFGSAENVAEEHLTNTVGGRGKPPTSLQINTPRGTYNTYTDKQVPVEGGTPSYTTITVTVIVTIFPLLILNVLLI